MKTRLILLPLVLAAAVTALLAQGPLTPPGPPGPVMKSLDQVEPRRPLVAGTAGVSVAASGTVTISQAGSYYLTGNRLVTAGHGIVISTPGVTLDLQGYSIATGAATAQATEAAVLIAADNVSVRDGQVLSSVVQNAGVFSGPGFGRGVATDAARKNLTVRQVTVNGVLGGGIELLGVQSVVEGCTVYTAGGIGIMGAVVRDCVVDQAGGIGINATTVTNCQAKSLGNIGIAGQTTSNCTGASTSTNAAHHGIFGFTVQNSRGDGVAGAGISAAVISGSTGSSSGNSGIIAQNTVSGSHGQTASTSSIHAGIISINGTVTACSGTSSAAPGGVGIEALSVDNSTGQSAANSGIRSTGKVSNSLGISTATASFAEGISASFVVNSEGRSSGGAGIAANSVQSSRGASTGTTFAAFGIDALHAATACEGESAKSYGIQADQVSGSWGKSSGSTGINGWQVVANSTGVSSSTQLAHSGIACNGRVTGSYGSTTEPGAGHGISCLTGGVSDSTGLSEGQHGIAGLQIVNSHGHAVTGAGNGLNATLLLTHSTGTRQSAESGKYGISAQRAVGGYSTNGESITQKYNMP